MWEKKISTNQKEKKKENRRTSTQEGSLNVMWQILRKSSQMDKAATLLQIAATGVITITENISFLRRTLISSVFSGNVWEGNVWIQDVNLFSDS